MNKLALGILLFIGLSTVFSVGFMSEVKKEYRGEEEILLGIFCALLATGPIMALF